MATLTAHFKSAVLWNTGFHLLRDAVQFVQMLVLARFLSQADYGKFAVVISIVGFLSIFSSKPFIDHTLQVARDEDAHFQHHFSAGLVLQGGMFLVTNLVALALGWSAASAGIAPLLHVLSLTFLLDWPTELRLKMLERAFAWKRLRGLHALGLLLALVFSVAMAVAGWGAFALVVPGMLVMLPFVWDLFIRQGWRPTWEFSWRQYQPAFRFGLMRVGSGLSVRGRNLLESAVLAAAIGLGPLGVLNRTLGIANLACTNIATRLLHAVYPMLTRLEQESGQAERAGNLLLRVVAWAAIPIATALAWLAAPVVEAVYGDRWAEVVPLLKWALLWAVAAACIHVGYMLVLARSYSRLCLLCDLLSLLGTGAALVFALPRGVEAYLLGLIGSNVVILGILTRVLVRVRALSLAGVGHALLPALASAAVAACVACLVSGIGASGIGELWIRGVQAVPPQDIATALLWAAAFGVGYLVSLRLLFSELLSELVAFVPAQRSVRRLLLLPS